MAYTETRRSATNGAAAYDMYGQNTAVRLPRQQQRTEEQAEPRLNPGQFLVNAVFVMVGVLGLFLILLSNAKYNEAANRVYDLQVALTDLQEERLLLQSNYEKSVDLAQIEEIAVTQLGMGRPTSGQTVYINLSGADRAEVLHRDENVFGEFSKLVKTAFLNLGEYLS